MTYDYTMIAMYVRTHLSVCLSIYLSTYLSIYLSIYLPSYLSIYLSIYLPACVPSSLPLCENMRDMDAMWEVAHGAGETSTCLKRIQWVSKNAFSGKAWFWAVMDLSSDM